MASVKISELNELIAITSDDFLPIVDSGSGTTYRVTFNVLNDWMAAYGSASHADIADFAWLAHTASYCKSSSYSLYAVTASYASTASYYDVSGFTPNNATNALYALTASCLSGSGTSWERNLQISGSLKIASGAQFIIPMKTNIGLADFENCILFQGGANSGGSGLANDYAKLYFIEEATDGGHVRFEILDNVETLYERGPDIDYQYKVKSGYGWFSGPDYISAGTGSLMFLSLAGELYVRKVEARNFSSSISNGVGFHGTASYSKTASYLEGAVSVGGTTPIGTIVDYAGTTAPADPAWLLCDGSEQVIASYSALAAVLGNTWGTATAGNFKLPNLLGKMTIGADGGWTRISGSVGNIGGGEWINSHYHAIAKTGYGWQNDGTCRNDDFQMWWCNYKVLNTSTQFPIVTSPYGDATRLYLVTGDSEDNDRHQPAAVAAWGDDGGWCGVSSYAIGNTSDMMPPYGVTRKIIRAL